MLKYIPILLIPFLISCFEAESPIEPIDKGELTITEIEMTENYDYQLYFNLTEDRVVSKNRFDIWHLAFECDPESYYIRLNDGKSMRGKNLGDVDFENVSRIRSSELPYELGTNTGDSTIIGKWWNGSEGNIQSKSEIYYINLGFNNDGSTDGDVILKVDGFSDEKYTITWYFWGKDEIYSLEVEKVDGVNSVMVNLKDGGEVLNLEPPSEDWDLLFTRYTDFATLQGTTIEYSLTGVIINDKHIEVARFDTKVDTLIKFDSITFKEALQFNYVRTRTIIGYDWKLYDFDMGYSIQPNLFYVIRKKELFYYKLRFLDFLNDQGLKGHPKIQFIAL